MLLVAVCALFWTLWQESGGVLNFVDYNLPVSGRSSAAALRNSFSPWSGATTLGGPNVGFLGTSEFLALFRGLSGIFGPETGSRLLLILLVWLDGMGAYVVLRKSYRVGPPAACAGALFYIFNPWVYDAISQGHLYTLEILVVVPFLLLAIPRAAALTMPMLIGVAIATAVAIGSDYHFGLLVLGFLGLEALVRVGRREFARAAGMAAAVVAGVALLGVYLVPYAFAIEAIQTSNAPGASDLLYFSRFTSWNATFNLLRPGLDAWTAIRSFGAFFALFWTVASVVVVFVTGLLLLRRSWPRLTGSITLPLAAVASIAFSNGARPPTTDAAIWVYEHVPFAPIFRDPSKFLLFPLLLYVPAVALLANGEVPRLLAGTSGRGQESRVASGRKRFDLIAWSLAVPAFVLALAAPFLWRGVRASVVPVDADSATTAPSTRTLYLPPWQYVKYPDQDLPVNDPIQLYNPGVAHLGPDYDNGKGNSFLRWLYSSLYAGRTDAFYELSALAGASAVVARPDVRPVTGRAGTEQFFSPDALREGLELQNTSQTSISTRGGQRIRRVAGAGVVSASSELFRVHGSNLGILSDLASLVDIAAPAICFEPLCPGGRGGISIMRLDDPFSPLVAGDLVDVAVVGSYEEASSARAWLDGDVAYAEAGGAISEQLTDVAVGIGEAGGALRLPPVLGNDQRTIWLRVLRGPTPISYMVSCSSLRSTVTPPPTVTGYTWSWQSFGAVTPTDEAPCSVSMTGTMGAVAGGRLASASIRSSGSDNGAAVAVSPAHSADAWVLAEPPVQSGMRLSSTSVIVRAGGALQFDVSPQDLPARNAFVHVRRIDGEPRLVATGALDPPARPSVSPDVRWIDLGEIAGRARSIDIRVTGGTVAIGSVALAASDDMARLQAATASSLPVELKGNIGLRRSGDARIAISRGKQRDAYVIVRAAGDAFWRLDGRPADGQYAGYGQIFRIAATKDSWRLENVLADRAAQGGVVTALTAACLLVLARRSRRRL